MFLLISNNQLPKWFRETLGIRVIVLNHCNYCVEHHFTGLKRLLGDDLCRAINTKLVGNIRKILLALRSTGYTGGEISEINQASTLQTLPACEPDDYADSAGKVSGFSLHAGVSARADERKKLERLCRYIALHGCRVFKRIGTIASAAARQYRKGACR